jgi:transcription elongation factor GreA
MDRHPISKEGFASLRGRLRELKETERPAILAAVQRARDLGDLSENADYKAAKEQQRHIDAEIRRLEAIVNSADVIDVSMLSGDRVMFGASVVIEGADGKRVKYKILAECESDLSKCIIANTSPLARGLIGKCVGDGCMIRTPAGDKEYEIIDIKYGE